MTNGRNLKKWKTEELEQAIFSDSLDRLQKYEAERILRQREKAPELRLTRRLYNVAAWTLAFALGAFIVSLMAYWRISMGG